MRIRKRQVPLPLSSLSPVPLSDLHLDQSVQLPPSDQPLPLIRRRSGAAHLEKEEEDDEERSWSKGDMNKISYSKNPSSSNPVTVSSSNNQVEERWCEGVDKVKKRRGREEYGVEIIVKKKRLGKGVVMEGSRCSRVNGRGWRCCQQTLLGYSLCDHHLGKGRLRGVSATPNKKKKNVIDHDHNNNIMVTSLENNKTKRPEPVSCILLDDQLEEEKRVKLGMVKARSMSSLLGQPHQKINITCGVAHDHDHDHVHI